MSEANIARRLAAQTWGTPDYRRKLADGIWEFQTPRHGGIVIDVEKCPEAMKFHSFSDTVFINARSARYRLSEQHFAAFEEDCEAQIVLWIYADKVFSSKYYKNYIHNENKTFEEWKENHLKIIKESLEHWHPEVLKEYPVAGVR